MICMELDRVEHKFYLNANVFHVLKNISIAVEEGEKIAVVGHSGGGKTTLINILGCLLTPSSGTYRIYGRNTNLMEEREISEIRSDYFGIIFQNSNLINRLNVIENVSFPLIYKNYKAHKIREKTNSAIEQIGITNIVNKKPYELSGGQQQLVAIARAIVKEPKILIADEPTANLDTDNENRIQTIFQELNAGGTTLLTVTHNIEFAEKHDRMICIENGVINQEKH